MKTIHILAISTAIGLTMGAFAPAAFAQQGYASASAETYDGYCYARKDQAKTTGTVVGAVAGGVLGSQVSKNERGLGTVIGAIAGGAIGRSIAADGVKCLNGEYYSYQSGYYDPAPAPEGYQPVYYRSRPSSQTYSTVYYDTQRHTSSQTYAQAQANAYNAPHASDNSAYGREDDRARSQPQGWKDSNGQWRSGRPQAFGWQDNRGRWHVGQLQAYGWRDNRGDWHEYAPNPGQYQTPRGNY